MSNKTVLLLIKPIESEYAQYMPSYAHEHDAGMDLRSRLDMIIKPGQCVLVPTGMMIELPVGYEMQVRPRSGIALKNMVSVLNSPGTVDCNYRGEVGVIMMNHGNVEFKISAGDRIAQAVVCKLPTVKVQYVDPKTGSLSDTSRGSGGFGSSGIK